MMNFFGVCFNVILLTWFSLSFFWPVGSKIYQSYLSSKKQNQTKDKTKQKPSSNTVNFLFCFVSVSLISVLFLFHCLLLFLAVNLSRFDFFYAFQLHYYVIYLCSFEFLFCFKRQCFFVQPWLSQNMLCRPDWHQTYRESPATASRVLGLKAWTTVPLS